MQASGIVRSKKFSNSGAAMFAIGGKTYFVSRDVPMQGLEPNANIEFEWEEFGDDRGRGRPRTITRWRMAQAGYGGGEPQRTGNAGNASQSRSDGASQAAPSDALYLPFISNTVAHAIQAGLIKQPLDLTGWVLAARMALATKTPPTQPRQSAPASDPQPATADEDFDDDIPF